MFYSKIKKGKKMVSKRKKTQRIHYEQALEILKTYQSEDLCVADVTDNITFPDDSISGVCQVPGCGQKIRYEYVIENKENRDKLIVGSTCVGEVLGLDEEATKDFPKIEKSIKDYHRKVRWERDNPDIVKKLADLKDNDIRFFRPFWEEVDYAPLDDEDTNYIKNLDVDIIIRTKQEGEMNPKTMRKLIGI